ncbi:MAG: helix-turn-helix transcriptional regulator [Saprospiraceae bacterium]|nr:helix-turn-helix transcriptional regulator [Saprospiraceae bacterium]
MKIGQKLRKIRQLRDMKQEDVAHELGIDTSIISKMENDRIDISMDMLEQLANVYGVDPVDILTIDDKIVIKIKEQQGGTSNGVTINTMSDKMWALFEERIKAQDATIQAKDTLQAKDALIKVLEDKISLLQALLNKGGQQ